MDDGDFGPDDGDGFDAPPPSRSGAEQSAEPAYKAPEPGAFDFDRPTPVTAPAPVPTQYSAPPPVAAPAAAPAPAPVATASESRDWTPAHTTDVETPRNEP
jgi:hypothetical protein